MPPGKIYGCRHDRLSIKRLQHVILAELMTTEDAVEGSREEEDSVIVVKARQALMPNSETYQQIAAKLAGTVLNFVITRVSVSWMSAVGICELSLHQRSQLTWPPPSRVCI